MTRIFSSLAVIAMLLLTTNLFLGLRIGDLNGMADRYMESHSAEDRAQVLEEIEPYQERSRLHYLFGVIASLITVLVSSITVTYFIGTSRWCREVVTMYRLDEDYIRRADRLKRRTFPWAVGTMLMVLGLIFLGAASLPGYPGWDSGRWVSPHLVAAMVGVAAIGYAFFRQAVSIAENYAIIEEIMVEVARVRQERGLEAAPQP